METKINSLDYRILGYHPTECVTLQPICLLVGLHGRMRMVTVSDRSINKQVSGPRSRDYGGTLTFKKRKPRILRARIPHYISVPHCGPRANSWL